MKNKHLHFRKYKRIIIVMVVLMTLLAGSLSMEVFAEEDTEHTGVEETNSNVEKVENLADSLYYANSFNTQTGGFSWEKENPKYRSWSYFNGIMMDAFLMMNINQYESKVVTFYDKNIDNSGRVAKTDDGTNNNEYKENEPDSIPPAVRSLT